MKIKCIALDLDRTTLDARGKVSIGNKKAIQEAIDAGFCVVVASGRPLESLPEEICAIEGIRYVITSNGASIYDRSRKKVLKQYKMTEASVKKILSLTANMDVAYELFVDGKAYAQREYVEEPMKYGASQRAVSYIQNTRKPVEQIEKFILDHAKQLDSLDLVVKSQDEKEQLENLLTHQVKDIYITSSVPRLLEISHCKAGKHAAVQWLLEYLRFTKEELAAFGDGDNDAELLACAGIGIAVENATEKCLACADWVTARHDKDGVALGIEKIMKKSREL